MKILVVGGTGLIGGSTALSLSLLGHDVTVAARHVAPEGSAIADLPAVSIDYLAAEQNLDQLGYFDSLVFAGGNDFRHIPDGTSEGEFWLQANIKGVPRFFSAAKKAGIKRAVYVGTYYPQTMPHLIETIPYVHSRHAADVAVRALASSSFRVCSVNPPSVIGVVPGHVDNRLRARAHYALGRMPKIPNFAIGGGTNVMSTRSLSEAISGALLAGEPGKAYLVGDENLRFKQYLEEFFRAAGHEINLPVIDREHPLFPDSAIYFGRGNTLFYEPDEREKDLLQYRRNDITRTVMEIVNYYKGY
ncbi:MAG TPA: nucleoside-diphosphate sugar epimerase [Rhodospirillaceae bacterium]|nr:nucleoside-diphosphate sugar epimerase [Candidatus Neomarinimicrobiota bacterium]HCX14571.1 nucleoside-diphosphate sugar epimerase [Rhodospirillaceae bacterium]